jgi:hypothetical protein
VEDLGAVESEGGDGAFEGAVQGSERGEIGHGVCFLRWGRVVGGERYSGQETRRDVGTVANANR